MITPRTRARLALAGAALAGVLAFSVHAQPGSPRADAPTGRMGGPPPGPMGPGQRPANVPGPSFAPEEMRARLARRLEETRRLQTRLERAIAEIDAGRDAQGVAREVMRDGGDRPLRVGPDAPPKPADERLSPEDRDRLLAFAREHFPTMTERLDRFREREPAIADRMLDRMAPRLQEMLDLRERDAVLFDLRIEEMRADWALGEAVRALRFSQDGAARAQALATARNAVQGQVQAQIAVQAHELELLTARLDRLRTDIAARREGLGAEVDRRVRELEELASRTGSGGGPEGGPPGRRPARGAPGPRSAADPAPAPAPR